MEMAGGMGIGRRPGLLWSIIRKKKSKLHLTTMYVLADPITFIFHAS